MREAACLSLRTPNVFVQVFAFGGDRVFWRLCYATLSLALFTLSFGMWWEGGLLFTLFRPSCSPYRRFLPLRRSSHGYGVNYPPQFRQSQPAQEGHGGLVEEPHLGPEGRHGRPDGEGLVPSLPQSPNCSIPHAHDCQTVGGSDCEAVPRPLCEQEGWVPRRLCDRGGRCRPRSHCFRGTKYRREREGIALCSGWDRMTSHRTGRGGLGMAVGGTRVDAEGGTRLESRSGFAQTQLGRDPWRCWQSTSGGRSLRRGS